MSFSHRLFAVFLPLICLTSAIPLEQSSSASTGKRGLAYNSGSMANMFESSSQVTWGYNWGYPANGLSSKFEFIPMLYGDPTGNEQWINAWKGNATAAIKSGSKHLLAFNEPDVNNLTPAKAATAYKTYMQPFASQGVKLGAPAVTNGGAPTGLTWLTEFLGNCTGCTIDFVPFHWYCYYDDMSYFTSYVQQAHAAAGNRPLWLTEFQGDNEYCDAPATDAQQSSFLQSVLPWLDSLSYMERYAYFGVFESSASQTFLMNSEGTGFSESGNMYATMNKVNGTVPSAMVSS